MVNNFDCFKIIPKLSVSVLITVFPAIAFIFSNPKYWFMTSDRLAGLSEKAMALQEYSSTLAWKIPWMEEPARLQSMGLLRVGHDWATWLSLFTFMHWRRKRQPTPVFLPRKSHGQWSLMGCRLGVTQSQTWLKRLSSSSSSSWSIGCYKVNEYVVYKQQLIKCPREYSYSRLVS